MQDEVWFTARNTVIAHVLEESRAEARVSVAHLAAHLSTPRAQVYRYLRGERPVTVALFMELCDVLGVPPDVAVARIRDRYIELSSRP